MYITIKNIRRGEVTIDYLEKLRSKKKLGVKKFCELLDFPSHRTYEGWVSGRREMGIVSKAFICHLLICKGIL